MARLQKEAQALTREMRELISRSISEMERARTERNSSL